MAYSGLVASGGIAVASFAGSVVLQVATGVEPSLFWAIVTPMGGAIVGLAGWGYKLQRELTDTKILLATANTKLEVYKISAPDLAAKLEGLIERFDRMEGEREEEGPPSPRPRGTLPFPSRRPSTPRRRGP